MDKIHTTVYISDYQEAQDYKALKANDIDYIINLSQRPPTLETIPTQHIPLQDSKENEYSTFSKAVEAAEDAIESNKTVLIHCNMGVSRSVAVSATAIASVENIKLRKTLQEIEQNRPEANPHPHLITQAEQYLNK